jgi:hypothetical protein
MKSLFKGFVFWVMASLTFVTPLPASAGNRVGNGGNAVLCKGDNSKPGAPDISDTAELLDFYEADLRFNSKAAISDSPDPAFSLAAKQLKLLGAVHPTLSSQLLKRLQEIRGERPGQGEIEFKTGAALVPVDDSKHLFTPSDPRCTIVQVAIRKLEVLPGEKRFLVRKDIWARLAPLSQAGLLTHELVYEYFFRLGEQDSRKARAFNSLLYGKALPEMNAGEYWAWMQKLHVPVYPE